MARSMIAEGRMPGSIDQVAGLIYFETGTLGRAATSFRPQLRSRLTRLAPRFSPRTCPS